MRDMLLPFTPLKSSTCMRHVKISLGISLSFGLTLRWNCETPWWVRCNFPARVTQNSPGWTDSYTWTRPSRTWDWFWKTESCETRMKVTRKWKLIRAERRNQQIQSQSWSNCRHLRLGFNTILSNSCSSTVKKEDKFIYQYSFHIRDNWLNADWCRQFWCRKSMLTWSWLAERSSSVAKTLKIHVKLIKHKPYVHNFQQFKSAHVYQSKRKWTWFTQVYHLERFFAISSHVRSFFFLISLACVFLSESLLQSFILWNAKVI